jgi:hypothetical protein
MKILKIATLLSLLACGIGAQQPTTPLKEPPKVLVATKEQSAVFNNTLLTIQLLRTQAEAATTRALLLESGLSDQIKTIADEQKIDLILYGVMRDRNGNYVPDAEGRLQFALREKSKP